MYYRLFNQGMKKSLKIPKMVIRSRNGNIDKLVKRYRYDDDGIYSFMTNFNLSPVSSTNNKLWVLTYDVLYNTRALKTLQIIP
jgi:hypothetical protein